jgi:hypothetical protein
VLAGELLGSTVLDSSGRKVGHVDDVRIVQDGPAVPGFGAGLRVDGLVVGAGGIAVRLGYVRHGVRGPALVGALARRLEQRGRRIDWDQVEAVEPGCVRLSVTADELGPIEPESD